MVGANLSDALFSAADLSHAHLMGANVLGAHFSGAIVSGVRFADPSLEEMSPDAWITTGTSVQGLRQSQLDDSYANPSDPPKLAGINDAETDEPLVWKGSLRGFPENRNARENQTG